MRPAEMEAAEEEAVVAAPHLAVAEVAEVAVAAAMIARMEVAVAVAASAVEVVAETVAEADEEAEAAADPDPDPDLADEAPRADEDRTKRRPRTIRHTFAQMAQRCTRS